RAAPAFLVVRLAGRRGRRTRRGAAPANGLKVRGRWRVGCVLTAAVLLAACGSSDRSTDPAIDLPGTTLPGSVTVPDTNVDPTPPTDLGACADAFDDADDVLAVLDDIVSEIDDGVSVL